MMNNRDKLIVAASAAGLAVATGIRFVTGRVFLSRREVELGRMLLGLVGYEEYERAVERHNDDWPGWHDGGAKEVKHLYKKLGA